MEQRDEEFTEILSLLAELREGTIPPQRFSRLDKILSDNPEAMECYVQIIGLYTDLEVLFKRGIDSESKSG